MSLEKIVIAILSVIAFVASASLLGSCKKAEDPNAVSSPRAAEGMIHFEDRDTGLCYSLLRLGAGQAHLAAMANVPCDSIRGHETNMPGTR